MKTRFKSLSVAAALLFVSTGAFAATSKTLTVTTSSPTFNTNGGELGDVRGCGLISGDHHYETVNFTVLQNQTHSATTTALSGFGDDNFLSFYEGVFDPQNPTVGLVGCNDDADFLDEKRYWAAFTTPDPLTTGQTYTAVFTGYEDTNLGEAATTGTGTFEISPDVTLVYTVGGTLSGLGASKSVVLQNNAGSDLTLSANGNFVFSTAIPDSSEYAVTVQTQPDGQSCSVTNDTGTIASANVNNVTITCEEVLNVAPVITEGNTALEKTTNEDEALTPFTLNATDADGDTLTWSISSAASHGTASISQTPTGLSQEISYTPDANYNGSDSFTVQVNDGNGGTDTIVVNVTITAVNDAPTNITLNPNTLNQDSTANTVVGTLSNNDPDTGDTFTYTLVSGDSDTNNEMFNISGTDLRVTDANPAVGTYSVRVNVNDGTTDFAKALSISVADNIAPVIDTPSTLNMLNGSTTVVTLAGTDSEGISWSIDGSENDNNLFNIDPSTGALTLSDPADIGTKPSYTVTVAASDGTNDVTKTITITVLDPVILNYQGFLATSSGAAVNETLSMTFKLYDDLENGNEVWSSTKSVVVTNGIYNVALGESEMLNDLDILDNTYYLGVSIESNNEMTPRQSIAPSGYIKILSDTKADK